jgi:hypothetical protein
LEDRKGDARITLRSIFGRYVVRLGELAESGSRVCPVARFRISGVEHSGYATRELFK